MACFWLITCRKTHQIERALNSLRLHSHYWGRSQLHDVYNLVKEFGAVQWTSSTPDSNLPFIQLGTGEAYLRG